MKDHTKDRNTRAGRVNEEAGRTNTTRSTNRAGRESNNPNLHRLRDLKDYKVASDDPDVRGWNVISGDNEVIGKVDELIVDTKRMKVRYLVVDANDDFGFEKGEETLLIPIGAARLHEKNNDVIVSSLTVNNTRNYPVFRGESISRDHEHSIRRFYEAGGTVPASSYSESITEHETIRDAHTGKTYARREDENVTDVDSNSRARVDVVTGTSGDEKAFSKGQMSDLPEEDRMRDRNQAESNTISRTHSAEDRRPDSKTPFGTFNHTSGTDLRDRVGTTGVSSSRTSNLPNKDLEEGPTSGTKGTGNLSEEERVRIHDTDPNVKAPKSSREAGFNETGDLNRSTSLGNDYKRGSNMGNLEDRNNNAGINDRSRMSSPESTDRTATPGAGRHPEKYPEDRKPVTRKDLEHSSNELPDDRYDPDTDEFYTHDHFDEDRFYGNRRNREK